MSEINVQLKDGTPVAVPVSTTVADALKKLDRDVAKQALAARGVWRSSRTCLKRKATHATKIEPVPPQTLAGLDVLRHSTAHPLAAAVLDLFPEPNSGLALLEDPRYGFLRCNCPRNLD